MQYNFAANESEYLIDLDMDGISERIFKFNLGEVEDILEAGDQVAVTVRGKVKCENEVSSGMMIFQGSDLINVVEMNGKKTKLKNKRNSYASF